MKKPKTTRRVGSRGKLVPVYLTAAALEVWYQIPRSERSKRVQDGLLLDGLTYAHNPTKRKEEK